MIEFIKKSGKDKCSRAVGEYRCKCGSVFNRLIHNVKNLEKSKCNRKCGFIPIKRHIYINAFRGILQRCNNKNSSSYYNYGGRGIKCERGSFDDFYRDMGDRPTNKHSIDRIDNNGNYCKDNCRWATSHTQTRNRRSNIKYKGKCLVDWASEVGIDKYTLWDRVEKGRDIEKAIYTKTRGKTL